MPNESIKRSYVRHQTPGSSNEKVSSSRGNGNVRMQEKGSPVKSGKPGRHTGSDQQVASMGKSGDRSLVSPMHLGNRHKPWPRRKNNEVEEVVKHMSSFPHHLQHMEKGDGVQEKALNIGVFDWESLEKLAYLQKQDANRRGGHLPSSRNTSPSPTIILSSSLSSGSNGSPLVQRKQSPSRDAARSSSAGGRRSELLKENKSVRVMGSPGVRASHVNSSAQHNHEKNKSKDTGTVGIHKKSQYADYDTSHSANKKLKDQLVRSREAEKLDQCEEHSYTGNLHLAENLLQDQFSSFDSMLDHHGVSIQKRHLSFDSGIENSAIVGDLSLHSNAGIFCSYQLVSETEVPVTNMKIATKPRRDLSPQRLFAAGLNRLRSYSMREGSSVNRGCYSVPLSSASESPSVTKAKHKKHEKFTDKSFEPFPVDITHRYGQDEGRAATGAARRDLSPHRLLAAGLNRLRSTSVKERSSRQQMNQTTASVYSAEDYLAGESKGRRSPLRRMLDSLLKSKNRIQFSGPIVSVASHQGSEVDSSERLHIRDELKSAKVPPRSSNIGFYPSISHASEPRFSAQDESRMTSTRQAVLKLAWKNGLPLFMFFSDNNNILAATVRKRNFSEKKDYECLYTIFTAHEVKKKSGAWMSQGRKSKKQGLVYDVVGHIRASFVKPPNYFPMSDSEMREFILFGSGLIPTTEKHFSSHFNSELAAIFIKAPSDALQISKPMSSAEDASSCCRAEGPENLALSSIVAVLPKGVHGLSSEGQPSPLIERWKSGGSCDCGGWDEGCMLSVLSEHRDSTSSQACNVDGTHPIELFTQASEARANKQAFSMDTFGEGVYTVDFRGSVASVQAFAICVAILHCRKSTNLSGLQYSGGAQNLQEDAFPDYTEMVSTKTKGEDPANYVADPPPPSPVGRA